MILLERRNALLALTGTLLLAKRFTQYQAIEYYDAPFTLADSVYGSTFFFGTGFHGIHVLVGGIFLLVGTLRLGLDHFSGQHHVGLEAAI